MNKAEKIKFIKSQLRDLKTHEQLFKQGLSSITSRKRYLELELESLGASNSAHRGEIENVLTEKQRLDLFASLTK